MKNQNNIFKNFNEKQIDAIKYIWEKTLTITIYDMCYFQFFPEVYLYCIKNNKKIFSNRESWESKNIEMVIDLYKVKSFVQKEYKNLNIPNKDKKIHYSIEKNEWDESDLKIYNKMINKINEIF